MPKITRAMGDSYGPEDAPNIRETDNPHILAVARDRAVMDERAETSRLRKELNKANTELDDHRLSAREQREQDDANANQQREQDDDKQGPVRQPGTAFHAQSGEQSASQGSAADVEYSGRGDDAKTRTTGNGDSDVKWSTAKSGKTSK